MTDEQTVMVIREVVKEILLPAAKEHIELLVTTAMNQDREFLWKQFCEQKHLDMIDRLKGILLAMEIK